jgi:hypothetical protein
VILAFLRAELDSPRFGQATRRALDACGGVGLVTAPDLDSTDENAARRQALATAKGWGTDAGLFRGFPADVCWSHGVLDREELDRVRFIDYSYWLEISGGSRRPADVAGTVASGRLAPWVRQLGVDWCRDEEAALAAARSVHPLIVVATPDHERIVVLDGHARLTGLYAANLVEDVDVVAYVGTSPNISAWALF